MSDLKYSRDISPQPVTGEFSSTGTPDWVQGTASRPQHLLPADRSETPIEPLQHHVRIRTPEYFANGNISLANAAAAAVNLQLIPGIYQNGIIRALTGVITGASATVAIAGTFTLSNNQGQIYLQSNAQIPITPTGVAGTNLPGLLLNLWDFYDLYVKFERGLSIGVSLLGSGAIGQFACNVVWMQ
jgi:hypothetical protein